jgi:hypothetical protein
MAFNLTAHVSCVINVRKPSAICSSAACIVGRSGPWSFSLEDGGSLLVPLPQASFAD